jgi:hypothetical protein
MQNINVLNENKNKKVNEYLKFLIKCKINKEKENNKVNSKHMALNNFVQKSKKKKQRKVIVKN